MSLGKWGSGNATNSFICDGRRLVSSLYLIRDNTSFSKIWLYFETMVNNGLGKSISRLSSYRELQTRSKSHLRMGNEKTQLIFAKENLVDIIFIQGKLKLKWSDSRKNQRAFQNDNTLESWRELRTCWHLEIRFHPSIWKAQKTASKQKYKFSGSDSRNKRKKNLCRWHFVTLRR